MILNEKNKMVKFKNYLRKNSRFSKKIKEDYFHIIFNLGAQKIKNCLFNFSQYTFKLENKKNINFELIHKRKYKEKILRSKLKDFFSLKE